MGKKQIYLVLKTVLRNQMGIEPRKPRPLNNHLPSTICNGIYRNKLSRTVNDQYVPVRKTKYRENFNRFCNNKSFAVHFLKITAWDSIDVFVIQVVTPVLPKFWQILPTSARFSHSLTDLRSHNNFQKKKNSNVSQFSTICAQNPSFSDTITQHAMMCMNTREFHARTWEISVTRSPCTLESWSWQIDLIYSRWFVHTIPNSCFYT